MHHEPEPPHEPPKTGYRWFDITIAVCLLLVSVSSLIVAIVHSRTLERMADANARLVEANSWPFLSYATGNRVGEKASIDLGIVNDGVGPAKIQAMELRWKGVPHRNVLEFLQACCGYRFNPSDGLQVSIVQGRVLRAGESIHFLVLPETDADKDAWNQLNRIRISPDLNVNVCFCSVFNECWTDDVVTFSLAPKRINSCVKPEIAFSIPELSR